jgi:Domain of unknown function (DUF1918)
MKAKVGDFLVVKGTTTERHDQHAEIIEVRSQDGSPPYVVRWLVTDHEATVYPAASTAAALAATWSICRSISPAPTSAPNALSGHCPARNARRPASTTVT